MEFGIGSCDYKLVVFLMFSDELNLASDFLSRILHQQALQQGCWPWFFKSFEDRWDPLGYLDQGTCVEPGLVGSLLTFL